MKVGETVGIRANIGDLPEGAANLVARWNVQDRQGADPVRSEFGQEFTRSFSYDTPGTRSFYVGVLYTVDGVRPPGRQSSKVNVTWISEE